MEQSLEIIIFIIVVLIVIQSIFRTQNNTDKGKNPHNKHQPQDNKTKYFISEEVQSVACKVVRIIDGDTVIVVKDHQNITIRLDAIDCPESDQPWGDNAKYGLIKLIGGKEIHIEEHGVDRYGRTLATLYVKNDHASEWMNVNEKLVTLGHAWVMRMFYKHLPKKRRDKLNALERWSRSKKVGLWKTAHPIPPWKWRSKG